ncbi:MAG: tape measure protein [Pseudoxanthomonas sp.]|uniref:tape measure protein n=1 Tax=Pseudoxanthomonas sp. TaxID=1871049 RepID=UPI002587750C|nr:tape measure protein [Pseudoxanthomonas sp.]MCH2090307.1 tape measure protein [Pseudoxanthomonas sp.]
MADLASLGIRVTTQGVSESARELDKLDKAGQRSGNTASKLAGVWKAAFAALSVASIIQVTRSLVRQADQWNTINSRIGLVTKSSAQLLDVQGKLFGIAQRTGSSFESTADLYVKLAQSSDRLRENQAELLAVTELVNKSLVVSGADTASAAAVTRQFAQALAAGALRGDEFVSVMEGAPRLARAIAEGLDVSVGKLRELAGEGKLTADTVTNALLRSGKAIDDEFGKLPLTVGRATQQVENAILRLIGKTDDASNSSRALARAISDVADTLSDPATVQAFQNTIGLMAQLASQSVQAATKITQAFEAARIGRGSLSASDASDAGLRERLNQLNEAIEVGRQWRKEQGNIIERLAGGRDFRAYDAMVAEAARIQQILDTRANGIARSGNGRGRGVQVDIRAPAPPAALLDTGGGGKGGRTRQAPNFAADAARELRELMQIEEQARNQFEALEASLKGPLAAAAYEFAQQQKELNELARTGVIDNERLAAAQKNLATEYDRSVASIKQQLDPTAQLIKDMEFELSLLGMTNKQRMEAIVLRQADASATGEQIAKIRELANAQYEGEKSAALWDNAQRSLSDSIYDAVSGTKSLKDAVLDFLDSLSRNIMQQFADDWAQTITSSIRGMGSSNQSASASGGASSGIDWGSLIGSLFGGGRASGGPVRGNKLYEVGERGPELLQMGGRNYMIPGRDGYVQPNAPGAGVVVTQNINVQGRIDQRSASQIATETMRKQQIAQRRTG